MTDPAPFDDGTASPLSGLRVLDLTRLAVMMYVRFPLSLRNVEDLYSSPLLTNPRSDGTFGNS